MKQYQAVYMRVSSRKVKGRSRQTTASQQQALTKYIKANRITGVRWY